MSDEEAVDGPNLVGRNWQDKCPTIAHNDPKPQIAREYVGSPVPIQIYIDGDCGGWTFTVHLDHRRHTYKEQDS